IPDHARTQAFGASASAIGLELRTQIQGQAAAKYRDHDVEYDVRVRLRDGSRNLKQNFATTFVPNLNGSLVRLKDVARPVDTTGPSKITRVDRSRYVHISADLAPGAGLGNVLTDVEGLIKRGMRLPPSVRYAFYGQAESYKELGESIKFA